MDVVSAYPPCTPRLQHNSVFWVHFPPRLSFGARFGWHGTGTVQPAISLSFLYLCSFIPRNEWHQNVLNSQILSRVTRPKMKMGIPLVCYQVILLPQRAHRPCKGSAHPSFHWKTKTLAEPLSQSQWGGSTADLGEFPSHPQDHASTGRLKAGYRSFS